jgi:hypothetical protein
MAEFVEATPQPDVLEAGGGEEEGDEEGEDEPVVLVKREDIVYCGGKTGVPSEPADFYRDEGCYSLILPWTNSVQRTARVLRVQCPAPLSRVPRVAQPTPPGNAP